MTFIYTYITAIILSYYFGSSGQTLEMSCVVLWTLVYSVLSSVDYFRIHKKALDTVKRELNL